MGFQNYGFEQDSTRKDPSISEISMRQKYTKIHVFEAFIGSMARKYTKIHGLQASLFRAFFRFRSLPPAGNTHASSFLQAVSAHIWIPRPFRV